MSAVGVGPGGRVLDVETMLITSFKDLRQGDGLSVEKLRDSTDHALLLQMLGAEGRADEGYKRLSTLVLELRDALVTRAIRNALVIGDDIEIRGGLDERREWATDPALGKKAFIPRSRSTHYRYEEAGFKELAQIIIRQYAEVQAHQALHLTYAEPSVDQPDWEALARDYERSKKWRRWRAFALYAVMFLALAFCLFMLSWISFEVGRASK